MPAFHDRVEDTTTTTGTGDVTLSGSAPTGRVAFNAAFGTGPRFGYVIQSSDESEWETGVGYLSASTTLVRETVSKSSNANAAVDFSAGTKRVFATVLGTQLDGFASISRKQGLWQFTDFSHATQTGIFVGAAITSGTPFTSLVAGDMDGNHQGVTRFSASSGQTDSGYRWNTDTRFIGAAGLASRVVFRTAPSFSPERAYRFGFYDDTGTSDPVDCAMIFVAGAGVAKGRVRANGAAVETSSSYSLATSTWYTFDVDYTADDTVQFSISDDDGTLLWQDSITDAQVPNTQARVFFCGAQGYRTTSGAADQIGAIDRIAVGPERPSWEAVPT